MLVRQCASKVHREVRKGREKRLCGGMVAATNGSVGSAEFANLLSHYPRVAMYVKKSYATGGSFQYALAKPMQEGLRKPKYSEGQSLVRARVLMPLAPGCVV